MCYFSAFTKLLVIGGYTTVGYTADVEVVDFTSSSTTCEKITSFPHPFGEAFGGLTFDNKPMVCGGYPATTECSLLDEGSWQNITHTNEYRLSAGCAQSPYRSEGHSLFVTGGYSETHSHETNTSESFNGEFWEEIYPNLNISLYGQCVVLLNYTTVMVIGGFERESEYSNATFLYNTEHKEWRAGPALLTERAYHGCGRIRKSSQSHEFTAIVVGGTNQGPWSALKSVEILDGNKWVLGPDLPYATGGTTLIEDPTGGVINVGGWTENAHHVEEMFRLPHGNSKSLILPLHL